MWNKKQRQIEKLEDLEFHLRRQIRDLEKAETQTEKYIEQLTSPSADMNLLFCSILDYNNILGRLAAADPIIVRKGLIDVFDKYGVKLPK